ncbi:MAG: lipid IV(A) 3-deoxy-D-manno-octulosonic acid transferase [Haliea sp.]|uniref:lipid IV(A) 3-deoxy-D-manno-octulosonic acid transferase n=1 Tax=Haliea sp. TaxID=1932666 RepID=UPI0032EDC73D
MLRALYSLLFRLALPFVLLQLWWSGRDNPGLRSHWRQRLGYLQSAPRQVIWIHAVSVGETIAAVPLVKALLRAYPDQQILMTAMTATGAARARALFGGRVQVAFSPYDTPGSVRRFLDRARPLALVILETELWPNMVGLTRARGIPVMLVNARLSARSARGYRRIGGLVRPMLASLDWIAAQAEEDARRFVDIGASAQTVTVTGSIKFDVEIDAGLRRQAASLRQALGDSRPVWIAASTHDGEDSQILAAHRAVLAHYPETLLILVPRHPERFEQVAVEVAAAGLKLARRARGDSAREAQVYLGDSMGELLLLYGAADLAFVAGSLIERGGHNPLEPAAWALPVITGPHVFNFEVIYDALQRGNGLFRVADSAGLADAVLALLADPVQRQLSGRNALAIVEAKRGVLENVLAGIVARLPF